MAVFKVFRTDDSELQTYLNSAGLCYIGIGDIGEALCVQSIAIDKNDLIDLIDELKEIADSMSYENTEEEIEGSTIRRANV